jgi:hypothetical protein
MVLTFGFGGALAPPACRPGFAIGSGPFEISLDGRRGAGFSLGGFTNEVTLESGADSVFREEALVGPVYDDTRSFGARGDSVPFVVVVDISMIRPRR